MKKSLCVMICALLVFLTIFLASCTVSITPADETEPDTTAAPDTKSPDTTEPAPETAAKPETDTTAADTGTKAPETEARPPKTIYDASIIIENVYQEYPIIDQFSKGAYLDGNGKPMNHTFSIPAIHLKGDRIAAFNAKLADYAKKSMELCEAGNAGNNMFYFSYLAGVTDNVVGIFLINGSGWQYSEWGYDVLAFYYDLDADRELTYAEYMTRLGVTEKEVAEKLVVNGSYKEGFFESAPVGAAAFLDPKDENHAILAVLFDSGKGAAVCIRCAEFYNPVRTFELPEYKIG